MLHRARRTRPSDLATVPADVVDVLLWRLAVDVAAAHRAGSDGCCTNLQCAGITGQCPPSAYAQRAMRLARTTQHAAPVPQTTRAPAPVARGRAAVTAPPRRERFTGWFNATATAVRSRWATPTRLPRRVPGATLAAA